MPIGPIAARFYIPLIAMTWSLGSVPVFAQTNGANSIRGAALFEQRCAMCHALEGEAATQGPNLGGVFNRKVASLDFNYSRALREGNWIWNSATLDRYLRDPALVVPGTSMQASVPDPQERRDIINYLATALNKPIPPPKRLQNEQVAPKSTEAFSDWRPDKPGLRHKITLADLPTPYETTSTSRPPQVVKRPLGKWPQVPDGFEIRLFAEDLENPRIIRTAPNGDLFVSETAAGRVRILRPSARGFLDINEVFASGLNGPFGIAFYPLGPDPQWVYVAETNRIVRYPYRLGETKPSGNAQVVVASLAPNATSGHTTRDLVFSKDGQRMFVSVGSASNVAQGMSAKSMAAIQSWESTRPLGATWGFEENRANVLIFMPDGGKQKIFATGLRNCAGLAVQPDTGDIYCATNERDGLGDNLVPDFVTRLKEGAFYGWPWWYFGGHEDPRWIGARPDLASKVTAPDVLLQPHSAPLGLTFYNDTMFPKAYQNSAFVALHGSWNRSSRTGYKVVRIAMYGNEPSGDYEDFITGFVLDNDRVWARPVGLTTGKDGALYMTEDGNNTVWRIAYNK